MMVLVKALCAFNLLVLLCQHIKLRLIEQTNETIKATVLPLNTLL